MEKLVDSDKDSDPGLEELSAAARDVNQRVQEGSEDESQVVDVGGVEVTVTASPSGETRVVASAPGARDLYLKLYPEGFGSGLGKVFGAQDVEVGESRFDGRYMIKASDESLARLWLSHEVRKLLSEAHPDEASGPFLIQLEGEQVTISWTGSHDAQRLVGACRAAAALGKRARALLEELRTIAEELDGTLVSEAAQWWPGVSIVVMRGELEVLIDHVSIALESKQPTLHTRFVFDSYDENARRAVICRPNAQKKLARFCF